MGFDERHGSGNLGGKHLADPQADSGDIPILDRAKNDLPGRLRPAGKKYLPHQAADLFFAKAVRIPSDRLAHSPRLRLDYLRVEDVARQRVFQ